MEWRCEWCGKPHDENDPPCDNCGHGSFEEAVVRQTDLAEGKQESTLVWVCTDCGREHPKHAPPCSRCGNSKLEKQRQHVDESELSAPGYFDLLTPQYAAALGVTVLFASVFVLGFVGVVDIPGFGDEGVPDVENVPGNATSADGVALTDVEAAYVAGLNDHLESNGLSPVERDAGLDDVARYTNQQLVRAEYTDTGMTGNEQVTETVRDTCTQQSPDTSTSTISLGEGGAESAQALGDALVEQHVSQSGSTPDGRLLGVDIHRAPDGTLYLLQVTC